MSLNIAVLMGRPTADIEVKHTQNDNAVCSFTLAVDRAYQKSGQEKQTDFIPVTCWRNTAEFCGNYVRKGQLIAVQGSVQTRTYTDKDGNKRKAFEVVADNVHFAEPKRDSAAAQDNNRTYQPAGRAPDIEADTGGFEEIVSDKDLPF